MRMQLGVRHIWVFGVLLVLLNASAARSTQYQLQIAHVEEKLFFSYVDTGGNLFQADRHTLPQLKGALDQGTFPSAALLPDRDVRALAPEKDQAKQLEAVTARIVPPQPHNPWMVVSWEGTAGKTVVLRIRSQQVHYQELREVAVDADGVLRRRTVSGIPLFGKKRVPVPDFSSTYIAYTLECGTFLNKAAKYAATLDGLSIVVGRNHDLYFPDDVYVVVQMSAQPQTYKIVLAWKDRERLRDGTGGPNAREN